MSTYYSVSMTYKNKHFKGNHRKCFLGYVGQNIFICKRCMEKIQMLSGCIYDSTIFSLAFKKLCNFP